MSIIEKMSKIVNDGDVAAGEKMIKLLDLKLELPIYLKNRKEIKKYA